MKDDWIDQARKKREDEAFPKYGRINPKKDPRCFRREMLEELLDCLNYCTWGLEKGEIQFYKFRVIDGDLRRIIRLIVMPCVERLRRGL